MKPNYRHRAMSAIILCATMICLVFAPPTRPTSVAVEPRFKTFEGAWFKISYPENFTLRTSLPSITANGHDSAFFVSPDGQVTFYVCSPQWAREPDDIKLQPERETLAAKEVKKANHKIVTHYTIAAKDESYQRSYQDTMMQDGAVRWVIGIQYKDKSAFATYKRAYLKFKKSLVQFGD